MGKQSSTTHVKETGGGLKHKAWPCTGYHTVWLLFLVQCNVRAIYTVIQFEFYSSQVSEHARNESHPIVGYLLCAFLKKRKRTWRGSQVREKARR